MQVGTMCDASVQTDAYPETVTNMSSSKVICGECGVPELAQCRGPVGIDLSNTDVLLKKV